MNFLNCKTFKKLQSMNFYSSTEIDPLQKFLFPCEIEALTGSNLNNMRKKRGGGGL